jgi:hypothetical protein
MGVFSGYDAGLIHPIRLEDGTFDASVPPINSIYTNIAFDDAFDTIWVAAVSELHRIRLRPIASSDCVWISNDGHTHGPRSRRRRMSHRYEVNIPRVLERLLP